MIGRRTARLRLLRRQERAQLLPVGVGERGQTQQLHGSGHLAGHGWSLTCAAHLMEALGGRLVLAAQARPVQSPGLFFLGLAHRLQ